jgi:diguanylate cyclase (GGDEF)-like protein
VRSGDLVGRLGGEEFGVFLPGANDVNAADVAERIRRAIAEAAFLPNGASCPLSVSVGGAVYEARIDFSDLFRVADQRLYQAKEAGRNRVQLSGATEAERRQALH